MQNLDLTKKKNQFALPYPPLIAVISIAPILPKDSSNNNHINSSDFYRPYLTNKDDHTVLYKINKNIY